MAKVEELLKSSQRGDKTAFEALVASQLGRLYRVAWRITGDQHAAEDVVQDAFLRILTGKAPFRQTGGAEGWLVRVVARLAFDSLRTRRSRDRREEVYTMTRSDETKEPSDALLRSELDAQLSRELAALPGETRAAVWLHVVEGQTLREVAACLECHHTTIAHRVRQGLERLGKRLRGIGFALTGAVGVEDTLRTIADPEVPEELCSVVQNLWPSCAPAATVATGSHSATVQSTLKGASFGGKKVALLLAVPLIAGSAVLYYLGTEGPQTSPPLGAKEPPPQLAVAAGDVPSGVRFRKLILFRFLFGFRSLR